MSQDLMEREKAEDAPRAWSTLWPLLGLPAAMMLFGAAFTAFELRDREIREVALPTYLIAFPAMALGSAWTSRQNPAPKGWGWRRPDGFFATGPIPEAEREERARRVRRSSWIGFGSGVALGLATSAMDFAWRGWPDLSPSLTFNLFMYPYFGFIMGRNAGLRPGDPKPSLRDLRFGMTTLMIGTAYLAIYLAAVTRTSHLSVVARHARSQSQGARATAEVFRKLLDQNQNIRDLRGAKNAEELRAGRLPRGLDPSQASFLKSLDGTVTEDDRRYRYGLIADVEQQRADLAARNVDLNRRIVEHYEGLAAKYDRATLEPWLPIAPDPPMPQ